MKKEKQYRHVIFSPDVLEASSSCFDRLLNPNGGDLRLQAMSVTRGEETWHYDNLQEFLADYRNDVSGALFFIESDIGALHVSANQHWTSVSVAAGNRAPIDEMFRVFESNVEASRMPVEGGDAPTIFIGHGRSPLWRELKDHLQDKHGFQIEAYEVGARAGHAIRDILEQMLEASSFALLLMAAEDETADGEMRPRQNVVHEAGLFQGRLGFHRAIAIVEEGVEVFTNIQGIDQIRFSRGNIKEVFGDVLATINREFGTPVG